MPTSLNTKKENIFLAYQAISELSQAARKNGYNSYATVDNDHGGQIYFSVNDLDDPNYNHWVRNIEQRTTEEVAADIDAFKYYWKDRLNNEASKKARKIAELKRQLAKLEKEA